MPRRKAPMTPYGKQQEQKKLRTAIHRWYRLGGSYDEIIALCDVIYATKVAAVLDKFLPKEQKD